MPGENGKAKRILIVEDDPALRHSMSTLLEKENYVVIVAENGRLGLEKALSEKPDLILLDLLMPELSGQGMLDDLRKDEWGKTAKVIVLTNLDKPRPIYDTLVDNGAISYLIKANTSVTQLAEHVKNALAD